MLRLTLEMVPFGMDSHKRTIGIVEISNIGGTPEKGDYHIRTRGCVYPEDANLMGFSRRLGAWSLVKNSLKKLKLKRGG